MLYKQQWDKFKWKRWGKKKKDYSSQSDLELLRAFAGLQTDDDVADGFSIAPHGILSLTGGQLCHLPFIHLLCFFDTQSWMWATLPSHTHTHTHSVQSENSIGSLYSWLNQAATSFSLPNNAFYYRERTRVCACPWNVWASPCVTWSHSCLSFMPPVAHRSLSGTQVADPQGWGSDSSA